MVVLRDSKRLRRETAIFAKDILRISDNEKTNPNIIPVAVHDNVLIAVLWGVGISFRKHGICQILLG